MKSQKYLGLVLSLALLSGCSATSHPEPTPAPTHTVVGYTTKDTPIISASESASAISDVDFISTPNSTAFSEIGYEDGDVYVTFRDSGASYVYEDVPKSVWKEFKGADSKGGYFNKNIKGKYDCYKLS